MTASLTDIFGASISSKFSLVFILVLRFESSLFELELEFDESFVTLEKC